MITQKEFKSLKKLQETLQGEKSGLLALWADIVDLSDASYGSMSEEERDESMDVINPDLVDQTAMMAVNTMADGIEGFACGPSIDWLHIDVQDKTTAEQKSQNDESKAYLQTLEKKLIATLADSNFYKELHSCVRTCSMLATSVMLLEWKAGDKSPTFTNIHPANFCIMQNYKKQVDTLIETFWLTKTEAINEFGEDNLPRVIIQSRAEDNEKFKFYRYIGPNNRLKLSVPGKEEFISIIWSDDATEAEGTCREGRMAHKSFICWRWSRPIGGTTYGVNSPGYITINTNKLLQIEAEAVGRASQLLAHPPWKKTRDLIMNVTPDGVTSVGPGQDFATVQNVTDATWVAQQAEVHKQEIKDAYYVSFFISLNNNGTTQMTAYEVAQRKSEQAAVMSTFTSSLEDEVLTPVVEFTYEKLVDNLMIEPPPSSQENKPLDIDYVSELAIMQKKYHALNGTEEWLGLITQAAQIQPTILDKINLDKYAQISAELLRVDESCIKSDEEVKAIRKARADAQMQQVKAQQQLNQQQADASSYGAMSKAPEEGSPAQSLTNTNTGE